MSTDTTTGRSVAVPKRTRSLDRVLGRSLRQLHRGEIADASRTRSLLELAKSEGAILYNGVNRKSVPRTATVTWLSQDRIRLDAPKILADGQPQIFFSFTVRERTFFFASPPIQGGGTEPLDVEIPQAIYEAERRDLHRTPAAGTPFAGAVVLQSLDSHEAGALEGQLVDLSYQGIRIRLTRPTNLLRPGRRFRVTFSKGERSNEDLYGVVAFSRELDSSAVDVGLAISAVPPSAPFPVDSRTRILDGGVATRAWRTISLAKDLIRLRTDERVESASDTVEIETVSYSNSKGQELRGILDRGLTGIGGTGVVIPPAWGRTKETFLALSRTIVSTFESLGEPVTVLRFDGTNRRGESYIDPECRAEGDEYLHFSFTQAIEDIRASISFLEERQDIAPKRIVLISFSLGSVEARRAVASDLGRSIAGWISVVGMVDLQSGLRTVSGGVDYIYGISRGVTFGRHEMVGVVADMDRAGADGFAQNLMFLEDVKRDMASIKVPITWIHGRDDAWMDLERVQAAMAAGPHENRKLIEVPTGHQMRSSREAMETFQLVSAEVVEMALGRKVRPPIPSLTDIKARTHLERDRRPPPAIEASAFWEDYLLGRDRRIGFELMSGTSAYQDLMARQIELLDPREGERVVDLGAGNGDFPLALDAVRAGCSATVIEVDLVPGALKRGALRLSASTGTDLSVQRVAANLDLDGSFMPIAESSADSILASLFLSYVTDPKRVLVAIFRLLRPGGRLVISSMRRDADVSKIYVDSIAELPPDRKRANYGLDSSEFDAVQRVFLNDAARLMHLEEVGRFRFWDAEELARLCEEAGFEIETSAVAMGNPPQAVIVAARRPQIVKTRDGILA